LHGSFRACPVSNIPNEDRFARQQAYLRACRGHVPDLASMAAQHVLAEWQTWHYISMEELHERRCAARADPPPTPPVRYRSPWHAFVSVAGHANDLKVAGTKWAELEEHERARYVTMCEDSQAAEDDGREVAPDAEPHGEAATASPFSVGSGQYPLSEGLAEIVSRRVHGAHEDWVRMVGGLQLPCAPHSLRDENDTQCSRRYGHGRCEQDFTTAELNTWKMYKRTLWALARYARSCPLHETLRTARLLLVSLQGDVVPPLVRPSQTLPL
jgi:hypothetical protein